MILRVCLLLFGLHIVHTCPAGSQKDPKDQINQPSNPRGNEGIPPHIIPPIPPQPPLPPQPPVPPQLPPMPPIKSKILKFGSC